jgi:hypothetical protein
MNHRPESQVVTLTALAYCVAALELAPGGLGRPFLGHDAETQLRALTSENEADKLLRNARRHLSKINAGTGVPSTKKRKPPRDSR